MPIIRIDFDSAKVTKKDIQALSEAAQQVVSAATGIEDVFVYANSAQISLNIAPIELFVEMSASKIKDQDQLVQEIKQGLSAFKKKHEFKHPINLTLIPMHWKIEINV